MATTILKGQVSLDFGQEAKFVHFSIQKRAVMVMDWLAQWGNNPSLVRDMAHYLLAMEGKEYTVLVLPYPRRST